MNLIFETLFKQIFFEIILFFSKKYMAFFPLFDDFGLRFHHQSCLLLNNVRNLNQFLGVWELLVLDSLKSFLLHKMGSLLWNKTRLRHTFTTDLAVFQNRVFTVEHGF